MDSDNDLIERLSRPLTLEDVAAIFALDLPTLCDAQLAQLLAEAQRLPSSPIVGVLEPLARAELKRRRAITLPKPATSAEDVPSNPLG